MGSSGAHPEDVIGARLVALVVDVAQQEREAIRVAGQKWPGVWHKASRDKMRRFLVA